MMMVGFRLHVDDRELVKLTLKADKVSIQSLFEHFTKLYLRRDPRVLSILEEARTGRPVPVDSYTFPEREREQLLDEISRTDDDGDPA
jgi:hypothetical protein